MSQAGSDIVPADMNVAAGNTTQEELEALREKLNLMQQIQQLQLQLNPNFGHQRTQPTMKVKVPVGSYNMSPSEFRTYQKDCTDYQRLTGSLDGQVVLQLRLNMDSDLKRIIDTNHLEWDTLTVEQAVAVVGEIVNEVSNPVVYRKQFDQMCQKKDETIQEFVTSLRICAMDCAFVCPYDASHELTDYHVVNRIRTGVYDDTLQHEILQKHADLNNVNDLIQYCSNFESTKKDREKLQFNGKTSIGAAIKVDTDLAEEEIVAAISSYKKQKLKSAMPRIQQSKCSDCGYIHGSKKICPAKDKNCLRCSKKGHFSRMCPEGVKSTSAVFISGVISGCSGRSHLTTIPVLVGDGFVRTPKTIDVIPDTGAEVTVAGEALLNELGIKKTFLNSNQQKLHHVAGGSLNVLGNCYLKFSYLDHISVELVYFVTGTSKVFLSIKACRELQLIHQDFPYHTVPAMSDVTSNVKGNIGTVNISENSNTPLPKLPCCPEVMPYDAIEENVGKLEQWFLQTFADTVFNINQYPLPVMSGPPQHIHLKENSSPYAVYTPIITPHHWREEVKNRLLDDVSREIIEEVPVGEPSEWCSHLVIVKKKDGTPRLTIDYQKLNSCCIRETFPNPYPFHVISGIPLYTYKTVADAYNGYHQIALDDASSKLTTFLTEFGRFRYLRTPQGLRSAGDAFNSRYDEVLSNIPRKQRIVDDTLMHDFSIKEAFFHTFDFLLTCAGNNVTLAPKKFKFARREVNFAGYHLGWDKYMPSEETLAAIKEFPMPSEPSLSDIRAWFGLVNQLAPFCATSSTMEPFRELLKPCNAKGKQVYWDEQLQEAFIQSKEVICKEASKGLTYFDTRQPTLAITDWSKDGIGFVIMQKHCTCPIIDDPFCCTGGWQLVLCGSRFLQDSEVNYAPIEGEALAITWCLRKAKNFLLGCPKFTLLTDHKPLVSIFSDKSLATISNPRLFRLKQKTLQFSFDIKHITGKHMCATDTLSRYPVLVADADDKDSCDELHIATVSVAAVCLDHIFITMEIFSDEAEKDEQYQTLFKTVQQKKFAACKREEIESIKEFFHVKDRLSVIEGIIMYSFEGGDLRLVIPRTLRKQVIQNLHKAHQGIDTTLSRARQSVYWPGLKSELERACQSCRLCLDNAPSQSPSPLIPSPVPQYPFQHTVADLFNKDGKQYLVYADRLTGWIELAFFPLAAKSSDVIDAIRSILHRFGVPEEISLDGGPNLMSKEFSNFLVKWGITRRLSSAYYPKSNGRAEVAVKTLKRLIMGNTGRGGNINTDEIALALLQYRNTPLKGTNSSPAQLLLGRQLRDGIPQPVASYKVSNHWQHCLRQREIAIGKQSNMSKEYHDKKSRSYEPLEAGKMVRCQNVKTKKWDRRGLIVEVLPHRQYKVKMEGSGRVSLRNRVHLRPLLHIQPMLPQAIIENHSESTSPDSNTPSTNISTPGTTTEITSLSSRSTVIPLRRSTRVPRVPDMYGDWTT